MEVQKRRNATNHARSGPPALSLGEMEVDDVEGDVGEGVVGQPHVVIT